MCLYYSQLLALNYSPSGKDPWGMPNLSPQPPIKVKRGRTGDAGDGSEWRERSRARGEH